MCGIFHNGNFCNVCKELVIVRAINIWHNILKDKVCDEFGN